MEDFVQQLIIGIGQTGAYFTLRETYLDYKVIDGHAVPFIKSFHHFNLSQDPKEAVEKAKEYAEQYGMPLRASSSTLESQMREIERKTAEEKAETIARQQREDEEAEASRKARLQDQMLMVDKGVYPFGRYDGRPFDYAPRGYTNWLITSNAEFDEGSIMKYLSDAIIKKFPDMVLPTVKGGYVGDPKVRLDFDTVVVRVGSYDTFYGRTYVTTMVDDMGHCIVVKSGVFSACIGDKIKFKATVKEHSEYNGIEQTIVQRVKVLES